MKRISEEWLLLIIVGILVIAVGLFQWNQTKPTNQNSGQDTSGVIPSEARGSPDGGGVSNRLEKEENNVTVIVEYIKNKSTDNNMIFNVALDTHSVNLDAFEFQKDVSLEKDGKTLKPLQVNQSGSGHHRKAEIAFTKVTSPITVVVMNVSNIPRREFKFMNL